MKHLIIKNIEKENYKEFLLTYHYLKRLPTCLYSFGMFDKDELIGVIIYGRPCSPGVEKAIIDEEFRSSLLELNRLCLKYNRKNEASYFISKTLKILITKPISAIRIFSIIVCR